jgi:hypothetical protein
MKATVLATIDAVRLVTTTSVAGGQSIHENEKLLLLKVSQVHFRSPQKGKALKALESPDVVTTFVGPNRRPTSESLIRETVEMMNATSSVTPSVSIVGLRILAISVIHNQSLLNVLMQSAEAQIGAGNWSPTLIHCYCQVGNFKFWDFLGGSYGVPKS